MTDPIRAALDAATLALRQGDFHAARTDIASARAALANTEPAPPADGEVAAQLAEAFVIGALLQQRHPAPVAVSERPWEREGWCNEQGKCWLQGKVEGDWRLLNPLNSGVPNLKYCFTVSLPAHALPLPAGEGK